MYLQLEIQPVMRCANFMPFLQVLIRVLTQAALRNSFFRVDGFGAEYFTIEDDVQYKPRDIPQGKQKSDRERDVCQIARYDHFPSFQIIAQPSV